MRILHVINNGTTCGGADRLTADLVGLQRDHGHQVHVLAGDRTGPGDWFADSTWPVLSARGPARIRNFYWNTGARAALHGLVTHWRPDVVHLHTIGLLSVAALSALRGVPSVMTVHGPEFFVPGTERFCLPPRYFRRRDRVRGRLNFRGLAALLWARAVTGRLTRRVLRRYVDLVTAPSPYTCALVERGLGPTRVVRNGLRDDYFAAVPAGAADAGRADADRADAGRRGPRLVVAGRLEETKGAQVLLAAMPEILAAHPRTHLTIVGSGELDESLRHLATSLNVNSAVTFAGWRKPTELANILAHANVAVVPSLWPESFGLAALEAQAAGCAVVASDCGGLSDLVRHNETGVLVPPGDVGALADAVTRLLSDPALRSRLAVAGRHRAGRLTLSAHASHVLALYREAITLHHGDGPAQQPAPPLARAGAPCR
jgi:glycosyltransferase involved in cell wall biosynthesis